MLTLLFHIVHESDSLVVHMSLFVNYCDHALSICYQLFTFSSFDLKLLN